VRLFIREKILIVEKTHDKKKEEVKPKLSGEKKKCFNEYIYGMEFRIRGL